MLFGLRELPRSGGNGSLWLPTHIAMLHGALVRYIPRKKCCLLWACWLLKALKTAATAFVTIAACIAAASARLRELSRSGGNGGSRHLYNFLLHRACVPYLNMLADWIYTGALADPYGEFMVREEEGMVKGDVQVGTALLRIYNSIPVV